jgi:hypothetical protein
MVLILLIENKLFSWKIKKPLEKLSFQINPNLKWFSLKNNNHSIPLINRPLKPGFLFLHKKCQDFLVI